MPQPPPQITRGPRTPRGPRVPQFTRGSSNFPEWVDGVLHSMRKDVISLLEFQHRSFMDSVNRQEKEGHFIIQDPIAQDTRCEERIISTVTQLTNSTAGEAQSRFDVDVVSSVKVAQQSDAPETSVTAEPDKASTGWHTEVSLEVSKPELASKSEAVYNTEERTDEEAFVSREPKNSKRSGSLKSLLSNVVNASGLGEEAKALEVALEKKHKAMSKNLSKKGSLDEGTASSDPSRVKKKQTIIITKDEEHSKDHWMRKLALGVASEVFFGVLIILNAMCMCIEAEYNGRDTGSKIGIDTSPRSPAADTIFLVIELTFTIAFTAEILIKIYFLRKHFIESWWNVADFVIIIISWIDMMVDSLPVNPMILRLARIVRLTRLTRNLSEYEMFDTLHLMIRGIRASANVLGWVIVLTFPMLASSALAMNYSLIDFMEDESQVSKDRIDCYNYFGTFFNAMLSMFELTFASFVPIIRFLYTKVGKGYALFLVAYKLVVGIAVLRIAYGVFMHVTFECATSDDESMIAKKSREVKKYAMRVQGLFEEMDTDGDGILTKDEFTRMSADRRVGNFLGAIGLEIRDAQMVYDLAVDGRSRMTIQDMVFGFSRLRGSARSLDMMALQRLLKKALEKLDALTTRESSKTAPDRVDSSGALSNVHFMQR